jgi:hypothetical protein
MVRVAGWRVLQQVLPQEERLELDREQVWHRLQCANHTPTLGINRVAGSPSVTAPTLKGSDFADSALSWFQMCSNKPILFVHSQEGPTVRIQGRVSGP